MKKFELYSLLNCVADGTISVQDAALQLKKAPFENLNFAKIDTHRNIRQGIPEVIYGAGKTAEQIIKICEVMQKTVKSKF